MITITSHERMHPLLSKKKKRRNQPSPDASNEMQGNECSGGNNTPQLDAPHNFTQAFPLASVWAS